MSSFPRSTRPKQRGRRGKLPDFVHRPPPAGYVRCNANKHWHHKTKLACPHCSDTRDFDTSTRYGAYERKN